MLGLLRSREETWQRVRRRILAETSLYIERGLQDRSWGVRIPSIPVGRGGFSKAFSLRFWQQVLFESA